MRTDTVIRNEGMEILAKNLGLVEAERFVMLIQKEPFNYTKWQETLFENMTIEEISKRAKEQQSIEKACKASPPRVILPNLIIYNNIPTHNKNKQFFSMFPDIGQGYPC